MAGKAVGRWALRAAGSFLAPRGQLFRGLKIPGGLGISVTCYLQWDGWNSVRSESIARPLRSCPVPEQSAGLLVTLSALEAPGEPGAVLHGQSAASEQHDTRSFIIQPFTEPAVSVPHGGCNVIA